MIAEALTPVESVRLVELERVISKNVTIVGEALQEIRDQRLYRVSHSTFEDYCRERWTMGRDYINKQIRAAEVIKNLDTMVSKPETERQARPLTKLPADQQPAAWEKAVEKAAEEGKAVTARHVEEAVQEIVPSPTSRAKKIANPYRYARDFVGLLKCDLKQMSTITKKRALCELKAWCHDELTRLEELK